MGSEGGRQGATGRTATGKRSVSLRDRVGRTPKPAPQAFGLVYFLDAPEVGRVKIGHTDGEREQRIINLARVNAAVIKPIAYMRGTAKVEHAVKRRLAAYRHHCEWFVFSPEVRAFIEEFAGPWPGGGATPQPFAMPSDRVRSLVADIRLAVRSWAMAPVKGEAIAPIDWSKWLPDVERWETTLTHSLADRCPEVVRPRYVVDESGEWVDPLEKMIEEWRKTVPRRPPCIPSPDVLFGYRD